MLHARKGMHDQIEAVRESINGPGTFLPNAAECGRTNVERGGAQIPHRRAPPVAAPGLPKLN
jgi:hypothetical protein